jgi:hypothetical protein
VTDAPSCDLCGTAMLLTGECWTCPSCGAYQRLDSGLTWIGALCDCEYVVPICAATVAHGGGSTYRNAKMRPAGFTEPQLAEVARVLQAGICCPVCHQKVPPSAALRHQGRLRWTYPPTSSSLHGGGAW